MKKQGKIVHPSDLGSPDLDRHHTLKLEPVDPRNPKPRRRVLDQRTIDRLFLTQKIDQDQWNAAQQLWRMAYSAGWAGNLESHLRKLQKVDHSPESYTSQWDAAKDLADLVKALKKDLGDKKTNLLLAVIVEDMACTLAASHYRLAPSRAVEYVADGLTVLLKIKHLTT
jgi:hypothetical protein